MKPRIAVIGNARRIGHAIAADLTLAGYEVNLFDLPQFQENIATVQKLGGIQVIGDTHALVSGKTGFAKINMITTDPEKALKDADVLFIAVPEDDYETQFAAIAPYIKDGTIVNFNNYGYWASLRVVNILKQVGKENVILTECPAPFYVARYKNSHLDFSHMRMGIPLSVFPAKKSSKAFDVLKAIYPTFELAKNILHTNFENLNMLGHPGIALLNVAYFDRAKQRGEKTANFYRTGITEHTGILTEMQDKERIAVCQAYGVPYTSFRERMKRYYGGSGKRVDKVQLSTKFIQNMPAYDTDIWARWLQVDVPFAMVPFVLLADRAGISMPIYRGFIDIFGAIFEKDFWKMGLTLNKLGLADLSVREVIRYVTEG